MLVILWEEYSLVQLELLSQVRQRVSMEKMEKQSLFATNVEKYLRRKYRPNLVS